MQPIQYRHLRWSFYQVHNRLTAVVETYALPPFSSVPQLIVKYRLTAVVDAGNALYLGVGSGDQAPADSKQAAPGLYYMNPVSGKVVLVHRAIVIRELVRCGPDGK